MSYLAMVILQAVVALRVWYLLSARRTARAFVMLSFSITIAVTSHELAIMYPKFIPAAVFAHSACTPPLVANFWKLCVPELVLQTIIFAAILWPAVDLWKRGRHSQLLNRIVRDGGLFYVAVFTASAFTAIGSLQQNNFSVMWVAVFSDFLLAITCISVSRLMLSIRTLAAEISPSMDLDELLSTAELNRVRWRRGRHDRELIVEIDTVEGLELDEPEGLLDRPSGTPSVYMSTVGRYTNAELELIDDV
ncbi:hypothetical protein FOMPIDRAFT_90073 [Fomitopsis schrenkii]|uniref:Uncharacterized protein n=1 Tax=Fomitopsis schrenkii TaxID=2126942 RepID=S8FHI1_FOMSC|nr:hypothetical protein FOMPIDRAFT_90073 [Fomitopsis schrenkii]